MTALLKGAAATLATRPLAARPAAMLEIVAAVPEPSPETLELEALRIERDGLREALVAAADERNAAVAEAALEGKAQGLGEARTDEAARLAALEASLAKAASSWQARLDELDGLAAQLARASVAKIFGEWPEASEPVVRAARTRLDILSRESVIALHVSGQDFPDEAALAAAAASLARSRAQLIVDPDLAAGDCRIGLKLGAIDIGPRGQLAELTAFLDGLDGVAAG